MSPRSVAKNTEMVNMRSVPVQKFRTKQPKPTTNRPNMISTEIRCQEKSKGGLCYEVILAQPAIAVAPKPNAIPVVKSLSAEDIEKKLREAEERRQTLEAKKIADWSAKMNRIEEVSRKKDELELDFMNQAKEKIKAKMGQHEDNREAIMSDIKGKLKTQFDEIEKTRTSLEQQKEMERVAIENKLKAAALLREENMKKMQERLKEHNTIKLAEVKILADEREQEKTMEIKHVFENKLFLAELKREKELQKKLENIRKRDIHAEMVRNKAAFNKVNRNELSVSE